MNIIKEGSDGSGKYLRQIGLFFFFVGCAGISIIVWIFNWICWLNQCCCCDFLHNPVNKRIAWWISFSFLLGVLSCCISGFVTSHNFSNKVETTKCIYERVYYDSIFGEINKKNETDFKKYYIPWKGLSDKQ